MGDGDFITDLNPFGQAKAMGCCNFGYGEADKGGSNYRTSAVVGVAEGNVDGVGVYDEDQQWVRQLG